MAPGAVHLAISLCLQRGIDAKEAVRIAVRATGLEEFGGQATVDTSNALAAMRSLGFPRTCGPTMRSEYPVFARSGSNLVAGTVDLIRVLHEEVLIIDFKSDPPPKSTIADEYPAYVAQVSMYLEMVLRLGLAPRGRALLLFTATGAVCTASSA